MKAYPIELRQRIVDAVKQQRQTVEEIAMLFGVSERYVYKLLQIERHGDDLSPKPHGGGAVAKLSDEHRRKLATWITASPDVTLEELRELLRRRCRLDVCINTVWRAVDSLGMTVKKRHVGQAKPIRTNEHHS